jgi:hypothetical protein
MAAFVYRPAVYNSLAEGQLTRLLLTFVLQRRELQLAVISVQTSSVRRHDIEIDMEAMTIGNSESELSSYGIAQTMNAPTNGDSTEFATILT